MIVPVVLSGGSGSRLWPLSRELYPKQMLPLVGKRTMLQNTVCRLEGIESLAAPIVVCNENHRFMVDEQLAQAGHKPSSIILEPVGRNTAPAIAVAALKVLQVQKDAVLLVLPADHLIQNEDVFRQAVSAGGSYAEDGKFVTFGIEPTSPETGYGYIKAGTTCDNAMTGENIKANNIDCFVEKPDKKTAISYIEDGNYFWNSGMFMFKASCYLAELKRFNPEMVEACQDALDKSEQDLNFSRLESAAFSSCPSDSIDYAVMEKTENGVILPINPGWSDVGSWAALWEVADKDDAANAKVGDVVTVNCRNSYFHSNKKLIAAVDLDNIVVVETDDAVMVAPKDKVQNVKSVVDELKTAERPEAVTHRKVFRPWGNYDSLDHSDRFQVKRITVKPGGILSRQMHHHRAEHWIIVKGAAKITKGDEVFLLNENESTYISAGTIHRIENPGQIPLEFIEVQSGSYLGEDDIVRFDDQYGRK